MRQLISCSNRLVLIAERGLNPSCVHYLDFEMAIRTVLRMGDPRLRHVAQPVKSFSSAKLASLVSDMQETMLENQASGLAATQIGIALSIMIFKTSRNPADSDICVLINPRIEILSSELEIDWEGCLSVPGLRGKVPRYRRIRYRGYDVDGEVIEREVEGFHARVVQHEYDHLQGVLYPSRIIDFDQFGIREELEQSGQYSVQPCDD